MDCLLIENASQLGVRQGQCPEPEVGSCIADGAKHKLNGFDQLMDENFGELEVVTMMIISFIANYLYQNIHATPNINLCNLIICRPQVTRVLASPMCCIKSLLSLVPLKRTLSILLSCHY